MKCPIVESYFLNAFLGKLILPYILTFTQYSLFLVLGKLSLI